MLHGSEAWPVKKENELTLQQAEMRMIRWMCGVNITDRFSSSEFTERLGIDDINYSDTATSVKMIWACFKKE